MPKTYLEYPKATIPTKEIEGLLSSLTLQANAYQCPSCGLTIKVKGELSERKCDDCATIMENVLFAGDGEGKAAYEKKPFQYEIADDMMIIKDVPVINTGYWNYRRFDKEELEGMVEEWGNKQKDLVADHLDDVSKLWGVVRKPRLVENNGVYTIVANLLVTTESAIKLLTSLEKTGKRLQISPRIVWELADGKEVNARIIHVAAVLRGAQGEAAELNKEEVVAKSKKKKMTKTDLKNEQLKTDEEKEKEEKEKEEEEKKEKEEEKDKEKEEKEPEKEKEKEKEDKDKEKEKEEEEKEKEKEEPEKEKEKKEEEEKVDTSNDSPIMSAGELQEEIGHVLADPDASPEALKAFLLKINEFISKMRKPNEEDEPEKKEKKDEPPEKEAEEAAETAVSGLMATSSAHVRTRTLSEKLEDNIYKKELLFQTICVLPQSRDWSAQVAVNIDEGMIDKVIENFEVLGSKVPVFIGHIPVGEEDKHLDQAIGWITKLSKEDGKLFATKLEITNKAVQSRVDDKTLQDASVGMLFSYVDSEGKQIGPVLRHLGIVAVGLFKGMEGFEKLAASDEVPEGDVVLEPLEISSSQLDMLREEIKDAKQKQEKFAEQYSDLSSKLLSIRKEDLERKILGLIEKGVIKPAYKDTLKELVNKSAEIGSSQDKIAEKFLELLSDGVVEVDLSKPKVNALEAAKVLAAGDRHYFSGEELKTEKFRVFLRAGKVEQDDRCLPFCIKKDWSSDESK